MTTLNRRTAIRIAAVSVISAGLASPLAWYVSREAAEESTVSVAMEESRRMLLRYDHLHGQADAAADAITGGLFDIAELYDAAGHKLAEAGTDAGRAVEAHLPRHVPPAYASASYQSLHTPDGRWVLRVFVPLQAQPGAPISGYFEGVRIVPVWQEKQMLANAFNAALLACLASLLCGLVTYPVVIRLSAENTRKTVEVLDSHISMMEALGRAIAKRDSDTGAHNYRVAWIAARIAERMGLAGAAMQALIAGSFLHDVGKIGIPDAILLKPGRLDAAELATMRTHVALGEEIVNGMGWLDGARAVVAGHHEKWDGSGYPRGLAGAAIPLSARIFAVADVFDALCSRRPYKEAFEFAQAMEILRRDRGSHFDPDVIDVFEAIAADIHATLACCGEGEARALLEQRIRMHFYV